MKTKIRLLILICALGIVGALNAKAATKNLEFENLNSSAFVFTEDADSEIDYEMEAQLVTKWVADQEEARIINSQSDNWIFVSNDEAVSLAGEEGLLNQNSGKFAFDSDATDYQMEAQFATKWVADREEAKAFQKLIDAVTIAEK